MKVHPAAPAQQHPDPVNAEALTMFERAFARRVPEVANGSVRLVAAVRYPGHSAKVAVRSLTPGLNAASACIGRRGVRVHDVERMVGGEQISVVNYDADPSTYVTNALAVDVCSVRIVDTAAKDICVVVPCSQFAPAIGKSARNVRLASALTGWRISVCTDQCRDGHHVHPRFDAVTRSSTLASIPFGHNVFASRKDTPQ